MFSAVILLSTFSTPIYFFSPSGTPILNVRSFVKISQTLSLCSSHFSLFSLCCLDCTISIILSSSSMFVSSVFSILLLSPSTGCLFQLLYILYITFSFGSHLCFLFLAETFYFFICSNCVYNCSLKNCYNDSFKIFAS